MRARIAVLAAAAAVAAPPAAAPAPQPATQPLPVLHVRTAGAVRDEPKVAGTLVVRRAGRVTFRTRIGMELRGHSSRAFPKPQYGLETWDAAGKERDVSLLGLPRESDWVLSAPYADKSLMRNVLGYDAARSLGRYASRTVYAELFLNGSYRGVYVASERPKLDPVRVVAPRTDVTGGYLLELTTRQKLRSTDFSLTTPVTNRAVVVTGVGGKDALLRRGWIGEFVADFERALYGPDFRHPERGWRGYVDESAAVDYVLLQEFFRNDDAFIASTFAHKPAGEKLVFGPLWDLDAALGNSPRTRSLAPEGWLLAPRSSRPWVSRLYADPRFLDALERRWRDVRQHGLVERLLRRIDADAVRLEAAQRRNFARWRILGRTVWLGGDALPPPRRTYAAELAYLKGWIQLRARWIDANIATLGRDWGAR